MLVGQYETKISPKRRVAIPNKLRKSLGRKMIVARWYEGCLVLVEYEGWKKLMNRLTAKTEYITQTVRDTDRFIMGSAYDLEPDSQGRVILPELLAKFADLKDTAVFLGLGDRVEIWDKSAWSKREAKVITESPKLIEQLAKDHKK